MKTYKIKRGDTLTSIAKTYGVTVADIKSANASLIKDVNVIRVGWEINIPVKAETFQQVFQQCVEKIEKLPEFQKLLAMMR